MRLKYKTRNSNTVRTTSTWTNRFEAWRIARGLPHTLHEIEREHLDSILQLFYSAVKENGEDYEPVSLRTMILCLDRFLREHKKPFSILPDKEFEESRKFLNGKAIGLREQRKGIITKKVHALTEEEENLF